MSESTGEEPLTEIVATCQTPDCENAGVPISLMWPAGVEPYVICGVCDTRITDIDNGTEVNPT